MSQTGDTDPLSGSGQMKQMVVFSAIFLNGSGCYNCAAGQL